MKHCRASRMPYDFDNVSAEVLAYFFRLLLTIHPGSGAGLQACRLQGHFASLWWPH